MSQPIELGSVCVYIGPGDGKKFRHRVIESALSHVVTWSQYQAGDLLTVGYSWMGPREVFCQQFRPCLPEELK